MQKVVLTILSFVIISVLFVNPTFAHVVISPSQVGIAKEQTFDISVPAEKDTSTVALKLLIPSGITDVTPNVKPGWTVNVVKNGDTVTEIDWTGGEIPSGQRDDFYFSAQVPATTTTLIWKAYQTYADGTVVNWDVNPATVKSGEEGTPYSTTKVINDLTNPSATEKDLQSTDQKATTALVFSIIAIAIACVALSIARRKEQKHVKTIAPLKSSRPRKRSR